MSLLTAGCSGLPQYAATHRGPLRVAVGCRRCTCAAAYPACRGVPHVLRCAPRAVECSLFDDQSNK
eukprot:2544054-Prymnesium_polylepis.1